MYQYAMEASRKDTHSTRKMTRTRVYRFECKHYDPNDTKTNGCLEVRVCGL